MKKGKRMIATILTVVTLLTVTYIPAFATEVGIDDETLQIEATALLDKLLTEQFEANKTGTLIDTSDILANTPGTTLYKQYLYWYSGKCTATQEYWTDYRYALDFDHIDDGMVIFNADLSYGRTCSKYNSEAYGYEYRIRLTEENGKFLISDIDTEEMNFYGFKNLIAGGAESGIALMSDDIAPVSTDTLDAMIADYADMKETMSSMVIDSADIVDMDAEHEAYMEAMLSGSIAEPAATSYSYDRERGRRYADLYYTESGRNTCFYNFDGKGGDCTNWVSQCVWAGYGGWTDGDSVATMKANIKARKRMQPSTNATNWYGHENGAGYNWSNVSGFWNLVTSNPTTGPNGTGCYDNELWSTSGMKSTEVVTGQVLQVKDGESGSYAHSAFVTGGTNDSFENIKITQHSPFSRIMLDEFIGHWGGSSSCYMRQLKFSSANFDK